MPTYAAASEFEKGLVETPWAGEGEVVHTAAVHRHGAEGHGYSDGRARSHLALLYQTLEHRLRQRRMLEPGQTEGCPHLGGEEDRHRQNDQSEK